MNYTIDFCFLCLFSIFISKHTVVSRPSQLSLRYPHYLNLHNSQRLISNYSSTSTVQSNPLESSAYQHKVTSPNNNSRSLSEYLPQQNMFPYENVQSDHLKKKYFGNLVRRKRFFWGSYKEDEEEIATTTEANLEILSQTSTKGWWSSLFQKAASGVKNTYRGAKEAVKKGASSVKDGFKRVGRKIMRGVNRVRNYFSRSEEKFVIFVDKIKKRVQDGDENALNLLRRLGINVNYDKEGSVSGASVDDSAGNVISVMEKEGILFSGNETDTINIGFVTEMRTAVITDSPSTLSPSKKSSETFPTSSSLYNLSSNSIFNIFNLSSNIAFQNITSPNASNSFTSKSISSLHSTNSQYTSPQPKSSFIPYDATFSHSVIFPKNYTYFEKSTTVTKNLQPNGIMSSTFTPISASNSPENTDSTTHLPADSTIKNLIIDSSDSHELTSILPNNTSVDNLSSHLVSTTEENLFTTTSFSMATTLKTTLTQDPEEVFSTTYIEEIPTAKIVTRVLPTLDAETTSTTVSTDLSTTTRSPQILNISSSNWAEIYSAFNSTSTIKSSSPFSLITDSSTFLTSTPQSFISTATTLKNAFTQPTKYNSEVVTSEKFNLSDSTPVSERNTRISTNKLSSFTTSNTAPFSYVNTYSSSINVPSTSESVSGTSPIISSSWTSHFNYTDIPSKSPSIFYISTNSSIINSADHSTSNFATGTTSDINAYPTNTVPTNRPLIYDISRSSTYDLVVSTNKKSLSTSPTTIATSHTPITTLYSWHPSESNSLSSEPVSDFSTSIPIPSTTQLPETTIGLETTVPNTEVTTSSTRYITEKEVLPTEPPPFPDIFKENAVRDRLHEVFLNADFNHDELRNTFDFDPALYEDYYDYYSY